MNRKCLSAVTVMVIALVSVMACGCASKPCPPPRTAVQASPVWQEEERWQKLKRGMTEEDVRGILGEPDRTDEGRWLIYWYYGPTREGPQVMFNADSRALDFWNAPAE